jgi:hypothetical protein
MSLQNYAILDPTKTIIVDFEMIDTVNFAAFPVSKSQFYRIVNMIAQPGFNPLTQQVVQTGWTITGVDVQPVWLVQGLTTAQQTYIASQNAWTSQLSAGLGAAFNTYIATAVPSQAQTNAVVLQLVKCVKALLAAQYNDTA